VTPKFTKLYVGWRVEQLNCDKGTDSWNVMMGLTLD